MNIDKTLKYAKSHEWVMDLGGGRARVGLTDYAQETLGDIVFVNLPEEGTALTAGETLGDVESVKAVSDIYSPVTGTVAAVNASLEDEPEKINGEPYVAWLVEVEGITGTEALLTPEQYEAVCRQEG